MSDQHKVVPCIRVFHNTDPDMVFRRLTKQTKKVPKVVLSVIGGEVFKIKHKINCKLKRELIDATKTTDAWLVTCGMHSGVSKFVGEAVYEYETKAGKGDVEAIGIAKLSNLGNSCKLLSEEQLMFNGKEELKLDPNHTQFVLVDQRSVETNEREIEFRSLFEKKISNYNFVQRTEDCVRLDNAKIPVVKIILGGDLKTLASVSESKEETTPVLVVDGTGGAADFIARVIEQKHEHMSNKLMEWAEKLLGSNLQKDFIDNLRDHLIRMKIYVYYSLDDTKGTLHSVLQELVFHEFKDLTDRQDRLKQEFELVYKWGRCDIAKEEIFNKYNEKDLQHLDLLEPLLTSLTEDRTDFVELLLDYFPIDSNHLLNALTKDSNVPGDFLCKLYEQSMDKSIAGKLIRDTIVAKKGIYIPLKKETKTNNDEYKQYLSQIDIVIKELLQQNSFKCFNENTGMHF